MKASDILLLIAGFILYLNYRILHAFAIHKRLMGFDDFTKSNNSELPYIITFDVVLISWYFFGWFWMLIALCGITLLNFIINWGFMLYKRLKK